MRGYSAYRIRHGYRRSIAVALTAFAVVAIAGYDLLVAFGGYLRRILAIDYIDELLVQLPLPAVIALLGLLCLGWIAIDGYKAVLLTRLHFGKFLLVFLLQKFGYLAVLHHLWQVYRERLLCIRWIARLHIRLMYVRRTAVVWLLSKSWVVRALAVVADLKIRIAEVRRAVTAFMREVRAAVRATPAYHAAARYAAYLRELRRYSLFALSVRTARTKGCCLAHA